VRRHLPARRGPWLSFGVAAVVLAAGLAAAEQPALDVRLQPERLGVEDLTQLVVTVVGGEGQVSVPEVGPLQNLQVVSGPSTENHFSWINGVATSSVRFVYLLQPTAVGPASVGTIAVRVGDVALTSAPISAEVVAGRLAPPRRSRQVPPQGRNPWDDLLNPFGEDRREAAETSVSVRQLASDREVVVGQPIIATVVLDTTVTGIEGFEWVTPPSYPGWWAQRVDLPEQISPELVERDGARYHRYVVARHVLVPLKAGTLPLPAAQARIGIRARSVFAPLQVVERASGALEVEVRDRPPAPPGYAGAVGDLKYSVKLEPQAIAAGESAVLTIELDGSGNLPLVEAPPAWPACAGCETYPPEEESKVTVDSSGVHGKRMWRTTLVPRSSGEQRIEPVTVAVYDPAAGKYRAQVLGPLTLKVNAPPPTPTPLSVGPAVAPAGGEQSTNRDGGPTAVASPSGRGKSPWLLIAAGVLAGALAGILVTWVAVRRRSNLVPRRRASQSPAERARELQAALESWWLSVRDGTTAEELRADMEQLRRDLESVRFAPGRADHSQTIADLEDRLKGLLRRP
jgi:hypothetical protein